MTKAFNHGYSLLIGVGESAYPRLSPPVTVKDTQALYADLIVPGLCAYPNNENHIRVLNDEKATRSVILDSLDWLRTTVEAGSDASISVYYSGHGWLDASSNRYYLLQHDVDPFNIAGSALSSEDFTNALRKIQPDRLLIILDCCHAAGMVTSKEGKATAPSNVPQEFVEVSPSESKSWVDALKQGEGMVIFTSFKGEQKSCIKDESSNTYAYHLLKVLQADNKPGDKEVRVSSPVHYLGKAVPESDKQLCSDEQNSWFDMGSEDFIIAKLWGSEGLPSKNWEGVKPQAIERINQMA